MGSEYSESPNVALAAAIEPGGIEFDPSGDVPPLDLLLEADIKERWRHTDIDRDAALYFEQHPLDLELVRLDAIGCESLWRAIQRAIVREWWAGSAS